METRYEDPNDFLTRDCKDILHLAGYPSNCMLR
jgi:hypothetical protein